MIKQVINTIAFASLFFALFLTPQLIIEINTVDCENQFNSCSPEIVNKLQVIKGKKLLTARYDLKNLLANYFLVKEYQFHFNFPDIYKISIIERKPKYAITNNFKSWYAEIDAEGFVVGIAEKTGLPYIIVDDDSPPAVGSQITDERLFALDIIYFISNRYQLYSGKLVDRQLNVALRPFHEVVFPLEGDKEVVLGKLIFLTGSAQREIVGNEDVGGKKITLDLRYKNPVIKF